MAPEVHDLSYYIKCMFGGMMACGLTHTAIVSLDVAKCRKQVNPEFAKSLGAGLSKLKAEGALTLGWAPTLIGYSLQGLGKFGFYEIFKDVYKKVVGAENADKYKKIGWSVASGSAEVIADCLLCPWEAIKLKIQLSRPGSEYPSNLSAAIAKLRAEEGTNIHNARCQRLLQGPRSPLGSSSPVHDREVRGLRMVRAVLLRQHLHEG
jgi:solute carrier family 25 phosphate transporter 3